MGFQGGGRQREGVQEEGREIGKKKKGRGSERGRRDEMEEGTRERGSEEYEGKEEGEGKAASRRPCWSQDVFQ